MKYEAGHTLICNRCWTTWRSDRPLEGYDPLPGEEQVRLTEFSQCPNGHLDTHWVVIPPQNNEKKRVKGLPRKYRILLALHKLAQEEGGDIHTFAWRLGTGRLPIGVEWALINDLGVNTIGKAREAVSDYFSGWAWLARHDLAELREKGYIKPWIERIARKYITATMPDYRPTLWDKPRAPRKKKSKPDTC